MKSDEDRSDDDDEDRSDDDDSSSGILNPEEALSPSTLALLRDLHLIPTQQNRTISDGDPERLSINILNLESTPALEAVEVLKRDGVVRLNNVLTGQLCDDCRTSINSDLLHASNNGTDHYSETESNGFGNVDSSHHRWDMYLHDIGSYAASMTCMFGESSTALNSLFSELFHGQDATLYEFAALVSDTGASSQRIHPDTSYQANCPLYTVFIATQDITRNMGPTLFIQGSNTEAAHRSLRHNRHDYLKGSSYHQALLKKGDTVVMDSRVLHCGDANTDSRRTLLYFTLLNPDFSDGPTSGSKFENLHLSLHQILNSNRAAVPVALL